MTFKQSVQHLMSIGKHAVGEEERVGVVRVRGTGDQLGKQGGDGEVLWLGSMWGLDREGGKKMVNYCRSVDEGSREKEERQK